MNIQRIQITNYNEVSPLDGHEANRTVLTITIDNEYFSMDIKDAPLEFINFLDSKKEWLKKTLYEKGNNIKIIQYYDK